MSFFFFFQAEDGIRDADVTGVQTCALPILFGITPITSDDGGQPAVVGRDRGDAEQTDRALPTLVVAVQQVDDEPLALLRSEERRVGKECRARGGANE